MLWEVMLDFLLYFLFGIVPQPDKSHRSSIHEFRSGGNSSTLPTAGKIGWDSETETVSNPKRTILPDKIANNHQGETNYSAFNRIIA